MNRSSVELAAPLETVGHFIDGKLIHEPGRTLPVTNPATGQVVREVALAPAATVERAIDAAQAAFDGCGTPP